jgi:hypothetical protein
MEKDQRRPDRGRGKQFRAMNQRPPRDPVVGCRVVHNVGVRGGWHVAQDATVIRASGQPVAIGQAAWLLLVAGEASKEVNAVSTNTPDPPPADSSPGVTPEEVSAPQPPKPDLAPTPTPTPTATTLSHPWLLLVAAGFLAGLFAAAIGEAAHDYFAPAETVHELQGNKFMQPTPETKLVATIKNGALANALLGGVLGLALGLAGGLARRSAPRAALAGLLGLLLGAILGVVLSLGTIPLFSYAKRFTTSTEPDLSVALALHAGVWAVLGAAGGLAFAVGLGSRTRLGRALFGGFLGALVGTMLYEVIGAVFFPLADTAEPIAATWETRALARFLVPVFTALALGKLALAQGRSKKQSESRSPSQM